MNTREDGIDSKWLTRSVSIEQAISENMYEGVPFGHANDDWERLNAKMQEGDQLWYFEPPSKTTMQLSGLALVRMDEVVSTVILGVD
jgi:hypothetical protein